MCVGGKEADSAWANALRAFSSKQMRDFRERAFEIGYAEK